MSSVLLLSMLMILLFILYFNNLNWFLNLNLIYKTLDWAKKWLVDFNAGETQLVLFVQSKMDGSVLEEK